MKVSMNEKVLQSILHQNEGESFECKRASVRPHKLLETVVALANTRGGLLVIGLEDASKAEGKERLIGVSEGTDNLSEFYKLLEKDIRPQVSYERTEIDIVNTERYEDTLVMVRVKKGSEVHSLDNGDTLARRGSQSVKIGAQEIMRLQYEKGSSKFEEEKTNITTLDALDEELLRRYKDDVESREQDIWQFLKDNGLAEKYDDAHYITRAGALLFCKNPSISLRSKSGIKISHYYGTERTYSEKPNFVRRPLSIEGPLLYQIQKTMDYFQEVVQHTPPQKLEGATFNPNPLVIIPEWVFQEAVTNAVIHRNYATKEDVQIRFFDDRIEIESPGAYPGHITPSNIQSEKFSRNPIIARTLNRFTESPNLDIGEGVDRMFEIMKKNNLYDPLYSPPHLFPHSVLLTLLNLRKIGYWDTVSQYLDNHPSITNKEAREITGIQDTLKMSRYLKKWVGKKLLEKLGTSNRDTHYRKTGQDPEIYIFNGI